MNLERKRHCGDDSEDGDDNGRIPTQSDQTRGTMTRKRRRGIIEKRRRDRINNCLTELKRLVPAAYEKQGSQKLEKAEILQMTVDHLRFIHSKGVDSFFCDPQRFATDYHSMGFRECAGEVGRYLSMEGMDSQDPVRIRLLGHLHSYNAQRLASSMTSWNAQYAAASANGWASSASVAPKFETSSTQYSTYSSADNGYSNGGSLNSVGQYSSATAPGSTLGTLRNPINGPFQPIGNGSTAGLNLNLTFLTPVSSANVNSTGAASSSISTLDKIGYSRANWNADVSY